MTSTSPFVNLGESAAVRVERLAPSDVALVRACQALRYRVYHHDLGLDTPDLDHSLGLDVELRDPHCTFLAARDARGTVVGCVRVQLQRPPTFYAEDEFQLLGPSWHTARLAEGARFAVAPAWRDSVVPLALFQAFRDLCRAEGIERLLSVAIVKAAETDRTRLCGVLGHLLRRVRDARDCGRPAPGYELEPPTLAELAAAPEAASVSPMLRLLATQRTSLCSEPAYCRRFQTFNFLLVTRL